MVNDKRKNNARPRKQLLIDNQTILDLHYLDRLNYRAIAEKAGCSKNTIMRIIKNAGEFPQEYWDFRRKIL